MFKLCPCLHHHAWRTLLLRASFPLLSIGCKQSCALQILLFHNWQFKVMHRKDIERQTAAARTTLQVLSGCQHLHRAGLHLHEQCACSAVQRSLE